MQPVSTGFIQSFFQLFFFFSLRADTKLHVISKFHHLFQLHINVIFNCKNLHQHQLQLKPYKFQHQRYFNFQCKQLYLVAEVKN